MITFISIHAPRAGGDRSRTQGGRVAGISIHAPRAGGDLMVIGAKKHSLAFQSTPPVRGATVWLAVMG